MDKIKGIENLVLLAEKNRFEHSLGEFAPAIESLNAQIAQLNTRQQISTEGLLSIMRSVGDGAIGIAKSITSVILSGGNRSELRAWCDKNQFRIDVLENLRNSDVVNLQIDIPTGMTSSYKDVLSGIEAIYTTVPAEEIATSCRATCDTILVSMSRGSNDHIDIVHAADKGIQQKQVAAMHLTTKLEKQFNSGSEGLLKQKFGKVFSSMDEMQKVRQTLLTLEPKVTSLSSLEKKLKDADASIKLSIDYIEKTGMNDSITKPFVLNLATYVRNVATLAESYSRCVTKQLALEHNLILSYEAIQSERDRANA